MEATKYLPGINEEYYNTAKESWHNIFVYDEEVTTHVSFRFSTQVLSEYEFTLQFVHNLTTRERCQYWHICSSSQKKQSTRSFILCTCDYELMDYSHWARLVQGKVKTIVYICIVDPLWLSYIGPRYCDLLSPVFWSMPMYRSLNELSPSTSCSVR